MNTYATATTAVFVNAEGSVPGRHRKEKQSYFKGFWTMVIAIICMFFALIVGTIIALAGLAGGVAGLTLVTIYLLSVGVLMWELLFKVPPLPGQHIETGQPTEEAWVSGGATDELPTVPMAGVKPRYYAA